jgi:hypothetical protein
MGRRRATGGFAIWIGSLLWGLIPNQALAGEEFFGVRNYNPFAQVFGLPGFADGSVLDPRETSLAFNTTVINHSDIDLKGDELITLDGESYVTNFALGFGVSERLTLEVEVPWVAYGGGTLDGAIGWWHDLWGFPNGVRDERPDDELFISYSVDGVNQYLLDSSGGGIGDVRLAAAYRLAGSDLPDSEKAGSEKAGSEGAGLGLVLRAGLKLPTGDAKSLRGSEATDFSLDLAIRKEITLGRGELVLLANAGGLLLGDGEVLSQLQRDVVGFGGAGAIWRLNERWRFNLQVYAQSEYFDSDLNELGSNSASLTVGGSYTWVQSNTRVSVGVMEDLINDLTPDVALQIALTKDFP